MEKIKISPLYNQQLKCLTNGKVKNFETLNYNTLEPKRGGIFCDKLFSSNKKICKCGNIKFKKKSVIYCKICDIEINDPNYKSLWNGILNLNSTFINPMYYKFNFSYLSLILNISKYEIKNILFNNYYIIIQFEDKPFLINKVINYIKYRYYKKKYSNRIYALSGAKGIEEFLNMIDLDLEIKKLDLYFKNNSNYKKLDYKLNLKKYKILNYFKLNCININFFFLKKLFLINCHFRPIIILNQGNIASSDLNELYKRIVYRNIRFNTFKKLLINNNYFFNFENYIFQESLNDLFIENKKLKTPLKSITSNIKGKLGLFRYNLLGKRVDFSARSVIVSGPSLNLDECGIPYDIAFDLFKPFLYNKLINLNYSFLESKNNIEKKTNITKKLLEKIVINHLIILNRAPTLHRLGIQSFKIKLIKDKSIRIHPLVCTAFNADFDGDQMAVHIPLSKRSLSECKNLLLSNKNILSPSSGDYLVLPSKDILLGLFYSSFIRLKNIKLFVFSNIIEAKLAFNLNLINSNTKIFIRTKEILNNKIYETTFGRLSIYNLIPKGLFYNISNKIFNKFELSNLFKIITYKYGKDFIIDLSNNLMKLGFYFCSISGISICIDDMKINKKKNFLVLKAKKLVKIYNNDYFNGLLSNLSRKKKLMDLWTITIDLICEICIKNLFFNSYYKNIYNSLSIIMESGARGTETQIKQICGVRGLIFYKNKGILDFPVLSNLKEGLNTFEYFFFSHSSRKVLADTSLKTSSAGYLTRKLVECCNNIIINNIDCGTKNGLFFKNLLNNSDFIESIFDRIYGRVLSENLFVGSLISIKKDTILLEKEIDILKKNNIDYVKIRSPITCNNFNSVCSFCYGFDLSKNKLVDIGEPIGILAAQSIGEPGTQLTMRTFHSGGAFNYKKKSNNFTVNNFGLLIFSDSLKCIPFNNNLVVISKIGKIYIKNKKGNNLEVFDIPYSSTLFKINKSKVKPGDIICEWDIDYDYIISEFEGNLIFENFIKNYNFVNRVDTISGKVFYEILNFRSHSFHKSPSIKLIIDDNNYHRFNLMPGYLILYDNNNFIKKGTKIIKILKEFENENIDIIGGLPKVISLFEARVPNNKSILAYFDGKIIIKKNYIFLVEFNSKKKIKYRNWNKNILVNNNQKIFKGDKITEGEIDPHDILKIYGVEELFNFYSKEIKSIYHSQGVKINDKHIEVILKQMLKKILITEPGKTLYVKGEILDKYKIEDKLNKDIKYEFLLLGITKSSLSSNSFLSEISFQNTNSILSESSLNFRENDLINIKESTMLGKLIPFGVGFYNKIFY